MVLVPGVHHLPGMGVVKNACVCPRHMFATLKALALQGSSEESAGDIAAQTVEQ